MHKVSIATALAALSVASCVAGPPPYRSAYVSVGTTVDNREVYYAPASLRAAADGEIYVWTRWVGANGVAAGELELNCQSRQFRQVGAGATHWSQANMGYAMFTLMDRVCQ